MKGPDEHAAIEQVKKNRTWYFVCEVLMSGANKVVIWTDAGCECESENEIDAVTMGTGNRDD